MLARGDAGGELAVSARGQLLEAAQDLLPLQPCDRGPAPQVGPGRRQRGGNVGEAELGVLLQVAGKPGRLLAQRRSGGRREQQWQSPGLGPFPAFGLPFLTLRPP